MKPPKIKRVFDENINKTINVKKEVPNEYRKDEIYREPLTNNVHTIQGVSIDDIDEAVISKIKEIFENAHTDEIKIYDFSKDRFNEIVQSWDNKTKDDSFNLPFVNISRESSPKRGTNLNNVTYNIPNHQTYSVIKVPVQDSSGLKQYEHYQVPQPINVDLKYEITVLSNTLREINKFDEKIINAFRSAQVYIKVNDAHYMAMGYENDVNENNEEDIEKRRFYNHVYNISLKGYLIPQDEIIMLKSPKNLNLNVNLNTSKTECFTDTNKFKDENGECLLSLTFFFKRRGLLEQEITATDNLSLYSDNQDDPNTYKIFINNIESALPINVNKGDTIKIENISNIDKNFLLKLYAEKI